MNEFEQLKQELQQCRACEHIFSHQPRPIFQGNQTARIMQISQAPSRLVMERGLPFCDASGKKLRNEWYEISEAQFYDPELFYIASIGRCFPGKHKQRGDLPPTTSCADRFLLRELALVEPRLYIIIGSYAARYLFGKEIPLEQLVFHDQTFKGKPTFVLPHPSLLNARWLKQHPEFETMRIPIIRNQLHHILQEAKERK